MSAYREWRERVAKSWRKPPLPPEVLEAQRIYEQDVVQFWDDRKAGDQAAIDRNRLYESELTAAECRASIHDGCVHDEAHDDNEYMSSMGYAGEPVGVVWGTVNPDGSVTARGFTDNESYYDDSAVHPAGQLVAYNAEDGTWVHMATGQTTTRQREIDLERAKCADVNQATKSPLATAAGSTSGGGAGVSHAEEGNAQIQQAGQDIEAAMGAIQEIVSNLESAQQNLTGAAERSQHSEADTAMGALQEAVSAANDLQQQVGAAKQAVEDVKL